MVDLVRVAVVGNEPEAELTVSFLGTEGIRAMWRGTSLGAMGESRWPVPSRGRSRFWFARRMPSGLANSWPKLRARQASPVDQVGGAVVLVALGGYNRRPDRGPR